MLVDLLILQPIFVIFGSIGCSQDNVRSGWCQDDCLPKPLGFLNLQLFLDSLVHCVVLLALLFNLDKHRLVPFLLLMILRTFALLT